MLSRLPITPWPEAILHATGPVLNVHQGQEIYAEGNPADTLLKVVSGIVRTCKFKRDGRRHIDAFYIRGDVFGFEPGIFHAMTAEAVSDCALVSYRRRGLAILAEKDREFADQLHTHSLHAILRAQNHARMLGYTRAIEKLAAFLVDCAERSLAQDTILLGMSRVDIADYLGLTEETVSRSLTQLRLACIIQLLSARQIQILDRVRLSELCG